MAYSADQAAQQVEERLKSTTRLVRELDKERKKNEPTLNSITKLHEKVKQEGTKANHKQKLVSLYTTALSEAGKEEDLIRQALNKIYEIRGICNQQRIQAKNSGIKENFRRGDMMNMLQSTAPTLPLFVSKPGEKVPPLCGAIPADSNYICKPGDLVAAIVEHQQEEEEEENWILAEVVSFNPSTNKYEVDDIDEEQKDRHILSKRRVVPLPLMRANPETDPSAFFPKGSVVMALYPQTTCFYKAVVHKLPQTLTDDYELLFTDLSYPDGYSPPLKVAQAYVITNKHKKSSKSQGN